MESGDLGDRPGIAGWRRGPRCPPSAGPCLPGELDTPCRRGFSALDRCVLELGLRGEWRDLEASKSRSCTLCRVYGTLPLLIRGVPSSFSSSCCCSLSCRRFSSATSLAVLVHASILSTCSRVAAEIDRDRPEGEGEEAAGGFPQLDISPHHHHHPELLKRHQVGSRCTLANQDPYRLPGTACLLVVEKWYDFPIQTAQKLKRDRTAETGESHRHGVANWKALVRRASMRPIAIRQLRVQGTVGSSYSCTAVPATIRIVPRC
eukprot:COSAG02_NODE_12275_length_1569_cov_4.791966_2_plen_261_part_01